MAKKIMIIKSRRALQKKNGKLLSGRSHGSEGKGEEERRRTLPRTYRKVGKHLYKPYGPEGSLPCAQQRESPVTKEMRIRQNFILTDLIRGRSMLEKEGKPHHFQALVVEHYLYRHGESLSRAIVGCMQRGNGRGGS